MRIGIMQPYFLPYIGYFQLMWAADEFVVYDNIQFSKKGWIHRNRILSEGRDFYISIPLMKDSDYLDIVERKLALSYTEERDKILRRVYMAYKKAPMFSTVFPLFEFIMYYESINLFDFVFHSLRVVAQHCGITTPLVISSSIPMDHDLKGEQRVLGICKAVGASTYLNPVGGFDLYDSGTFANHGIKLEFMKSKLPMYRQFGGEFVPALSILDVMMFNGSDEIRLMLEDYVVVES